MSNDADRQEFVEVFLDEEYGFRHWRFLFRGTRQELEAWWRSLTSVQSFFFSPGKRVKELDLGEISEILDYDDPLPRKCDVYIHIHLDDDSHLVFRDEENRTVYHAGFGKGTHC